MRLLYWLTWCLSAGGLSGAAAASHRRAAGESQQPADGRAVLPPTGRLPAAGGPHLHGPSAAAGDPGVPSRRLAVEQHSAQVLLQRNRRLGSLQGQRCSAAVSQACGLTFKHLLYLQH